MSKFSRRSVIGGCLALAAAGTIGRPHVAKAAETHDADLLSKQVGGRPDGRVIFHQIHGVAWNASISLAHGDEFNASVIGKQKRRPRNARNVEVTSDQRGNRICTAHHSRRDVQAFGLK